MAYINSIDSPGVAQAGVAVSPSDSTSYSQGIARGLYVGTTGNVTLLDYMGNTVLFSSVPAGTILPIAHTRVNSTGTTASNMVALF